MKNRIQNIHSIQLKVVNQQIISQKLFSFYFSLVIFISMHLFKSVSVEFQ